jgi:hypothetical protein
MTESSDSHCTGRGFFWNPAAPARIQSDKGAGAGRAAPGPSHRREPRLGGLR